MNPNKLNRTAHNAILEPVITAMVAMRLSRATSEHYHTLASAFLIASHAVELTPRHAHLADTVTAGLSALGHVFARHEQRTIQDAYFTATADELDAIHDALEIYKALLKTTPGRTWRRAIHRAIAQINK